ncbi:ABC transporter ATP-binding protein [Kineosporia rhizophila]|uniref:ABC transporter ATP-binding protein n=1 Tax=Kineosporia TaxID=49184 RepID=UPI001E4EB9F2|nr:MULTISPECIES: ABC transporter ATP-binding protein [Kineosporia]MCE0537438.1 ABC transporter ATP-binding protein [Kineosporia rhizophila]
MDGVGRVHGSGTSAVRALRNVDLAVASGSFTAVMGPSGSGKSTLLQCAAGLDRPTSGSVRLAGTDLTGMSEVALTRLRRTRIGFVFQGFNLLPALTARENVTLPLRLARQRVPRPWLDEVIERVGLAQRADHRPDQLSGGQQQRVAIARALITRPDIIFADEPTGALDTVTAGEILQLLRECVDEGGQTLLMVTHDPVVAAHAHRVVFLADGEIADQLEAPGVQQISDRLQSLRGVRS